MLGSSNVALKLNSKRKESRKDLVTERAVAVLKPIDLAVNSVAAVWRTA